MTDLIAEIKRLCAETDTETNEPTQAWLVGNLRALVARFEEAHTPSDDEREAAWRAGELSVADAAHFTANPERQGEPSDAHLSNVSINGVRQTWQQMYEREHEAHMELQGYRTMLSDLDRNASGRHEGDYDTKATGNGGISAGNPHLPTGTVIGYDIGGREYVVPEPRDRGTLSAWVRVAGGAR